jgi:hypothetical protein
VSGLLVAGLVVPVPGVTVYNPLDTPWCRLAPSDYRARQTSWIRQFMLHSTLGKWPQAVRLTPARDTAGDGARATADYWRGSPEKSAAPIVVDYDGDVACLCDVVKFAPFQATTSNDYSIGIEMKQMPDGSIYDATLCSTVAVVLALSEALGIPFQIAADAYVPGRIIGRMLHGGSDCVGIFGHRNQAWKFPEQIDDPAKRRQYPTGYAARGRGDPGDEIYRRFAAAGAEQFRFELGEDLATWKRRQRKLNAKGEQLEVDGLAGPGTMAALRRHGFATGRELDAARV